MLFCSEDEILVSVDPFSMVVILVSYAYME